MGDVTADVTAELVVMEESDRVNLKRTIGLPTAVAIIVGGIIGTPKDRSRHS